MIITVVVQPPVTGDDTDITITVQRNRGLSAYEALLAALDTLAEQLEP